MPYALATGRSVTASCMVAVRISFWIPWHKGLSMKLWLLTVYQPWWLQSTRARSMSFAATGGWNATRMPGTADMSVGSKWSSMSCHQRSLPAFCLHREGCLFGRHKERRPVSCRMCVGCVSDVCRMCVGCVSDVSCLGANCKATEFPGK